VPEGTVAETTDTEVTTGTVVTEGPDMSALQVTNRRAVRRAHLTISDAEKAGDRAKAQEGKVALVKALTEGRALVRADVLDVEDRAEKAREDLAGLDAIVKTYKAHTVATVGLAGFHLGATEIMRSLFGFEGKTETTEGNTLQKRVTRIMTRGMTLAIARDAKGATLTREEEKALAKVAPTSAKAAKALTMTADDVARLAPREVVEVTPEEVATKALAKVDGLITRTEEALQTLQRVMSDLPAEKAAEVAKVTARVEALLTVWTTAPVAIEEGPSDDDLAEIEEETTA
jgi:hypothetical protein